MSIQKAYDRWARTYDTDENLTRDLDAIITEQFLRNRQINTVLEIGCGTGKNTNQLARIANQVYAVDFSTGMINKAIVQVQASNVSFIVADLTYKWPFKSHYADLLVCNLVLEHIADLSFIFSEASRSLIENGQFFISELHPFKQYQGKQASFNQDDVTKQIPAFTHHISDFLKAAEMHGLRLLELREWWHEKDQDNPPRLVSFIFQKSSLASNKNHIEV